jgi:hypothetical protein
MVLVAMPMLLAFVARRDLTWQPARWLLVAILSGCLVHLFLPGFTPDRPRDMTLMYTEVGGAEQGHIVLESLYRQPDMRYARSHDFELQDLNDGRLGTVQRPARTVAALQLPGVNPVSQQVTETDEGFLWRLQMALPPGSRFLRVTIPEEAGLLKAWVNGQLALDTGIEIKQSRPRNSVRLLYPGPGSVEFEFLTESGDAAPAAVVTWHDLPGVLTAPFMGNWPDDARPAQYGPRAEKIQRIELVGGE